jgi:hypothetical protein
MEGWMTTTKQDIDAALARLVRHGGDNYLPEFVAILFEDR